MAQNQPIKHLIPKTDENFKQYCDAGITLEELDKALGALSKDKAPGCDGLTSNFYIYFWDHTRILVFEMLTEILENTMNQIPKILQIIENFSKASGLKLNSDKCEILPLKDCTISNTFNIPVKKSNVKYLVCI